MINKEEIYFSKIINIAKAYEGSKTLLVAHELDLFSLLAKRPLTCLDVSTKLNLDLRATNLFLDALVGLQLLQKKKGKYYNSPHSQDHLVKGKRDYVGPYLDLTIKNCEPWDHLKEALTTGKPILKKKKSSVKFFDEAFTHGMFGLSKGSAENIYSLVDLNKRKKLLDFGGGPGTYSVVFAQKNKDLKAHVFDLPKVIEVANYFIKKFGSRSSRG